MKISSLAASKQTSIRSDFLVLRDTKEMEKAKVFEAAAT